MSRSVRGICANPQVGDCAVSRGSVSNRPRLCENSEIVRKRRIWSELFRFAEPVMAKNGRKSTGIYRLPPVVRVFSHSLDPKPPFASVDSNAGPCPNPAIALAERGRLDWGELSFGMPPLVGRDPALCCPHS